MATPEFKFTKAAIEKLPIPPPERKRDMHRDTESKYLRLIVTPAGSRVFYFVRKWEGETKFWKIGAFPEVSIHEARAAAEEYSANLRRGEPTKKERTASMTLGALFEQFVEEYAKERKKTWRDDIQRFNAHLSHWQNRKAAKITRRDVKRLHRELKQDQGRDDRGVKRGGPYSANRTLALLRKLYNWAQEEEVIILPEGNPAANVKPHPEQERETRLEGDTLAAFWAAMDSDETAPFWFDFFALLLLTGCRRSELQSMEWKELNFRAGKWIVPPEKSKNGKPMEKILVAEAVEILERRRTETDSRYVFPSPKKPETHVTECRKAWLRLCKLGGLEGIRVHDIRRTNASFQVDEGAGENVISKALGHQSQKTTARYARAAMSSVRSSMERAAAAMLGDRSVENEIDQR